jgi:hypothetical protein
VRRISFQCVPCGAYRRGVLLFMYAYLEAKQGDLFARQQVIPP